MRLIGHHWPSVRSSRLQMFFKKSFLKTSPISQKNTCAGVSFHCEIGDIFKNTSFLQNTSGGCFWSVFCSNPKASRTYSFNCVFLLLAALRILFFFYQGFLSRTLTIHRTAREGRGPSFIPLYHFHPLTNIEIFICNLACEMTITYF